MRAHGLSAGDAQATMWFFEKRLWGAQGLTVDEGTNSAGAKKLVESHDLVFDDRAGSDGQDNATGTGAARTGGQPAESLSVPGAPFSKAKLLALGVPEDLYSAASMYASEEEAAEDLARAKPTQGTA
jgi:hypothetical protein